MRDRRFHGGLKSIDVVIQIAPIEAIVVRRRARTSDDGDVISHLKSDVPRP